MKKIIQEFNVYNFNELNDKAKNHAITAERCRGNRLDYEWWDGVFESFSRKFEEIGIYNAELHFSLAYCQGDYARISEGTIATDKVIKMFLPGLKYHLTQYMIDYTSIYFDMYHNIVVDFDCYKDIPHIKSYLEDMAAKLEEILNDKVETLNKQLYRELSDTYDSLQSDETISEELEANEILFYEDGRIFSY